MTLHDANMTVRPMVATIGARWPCVCTNRRHASAASAKRKAACLVLWHDTAAHLFRPLHRIAMVVVSGIGRLRSVLHQDGARSQPKGPGSNPGDQGQHSTLSKLPNLVGMLIYYRRKWARQEMNIIEYKNPVPPVSSGTGQVQHRTASCAAPGLRPTAATGRTVSARQSMRKALTAADRHPPSSRQSPAVPVTRLTIVRYGATPRRSDALPRVGTRRTTTRNAIRWIFRGNWPLRPKSSASR